MSSYTREEIIAAIQQATANDGGKPVGYRRLETLTGITRGTWYGVYWARWSDALRDAGFEPNQASPAIDKDAVLQRTAEMVRQLGKLPSEGDLRIARRSEPTLPSVKALRSFGLRSDLLTKLRELAISNPAYHDILDMLPTPTTDTEDDNDHDAEALPVSPVVTGQVYLARMGKYYKIGFSRAVGRRIYELERHQPEPLTLVHTLQTDDPEGIERYWHERFKDKRGNGEWFLLSPEDVAAFKRRRRFM